MSTEPNRSTVAATQASACSGSPALATRPGHLAGPVAPRRPRSSAADSVQPLGPPGREHHRGPGVGEGPGDGLADPPRAAGDQRRLAVESEFHGGPPWPIRPRPGTGVRRCGECRRRGGPVRVRRRSRHHPAPAGPPAGHARRRRRRGPDGRRPGGGHPPRRAGRRRARAGSGLPCVIHLDDATQRRLDDRMAKASDPRFCGEEPTPPVATLGQVSCNRPADEASPHLRRHADVPGVAPLMLSSDHALAAQPARSGRSRSR